VVVDADEVLPYADGRILVRRIHPGGVPGARVFVDDLEIVPHADGLALIETSAPIETIGGAAASWTMQELRGFEPNGHGLGFVLMARE
jgi:hypothetical protein